MKGANMKLRNKKTGEIWDIGKILTNDYPSYDRLKDIIDDFEDIQQGPLIKDKKQREAVRAWANSENSRAIFYAERQNKSLCNLSDYDGDSSISFTGWIPTLKDGKCYTINELCGDEK